MGLLSFLKRENERLRAPLKAQAYHTTAPSQPPVKGTYPIAGTKPPIRKHVPRRVDTNEPSSPVTSFPQPPNLREIERASRDLPPERPITAQSNDRPSSSHQRPPSRFRRESRAPPVSFRKPRAATPKQQPEPNDEIRFDQNPVVNPPPRPPTSHGHGRTSSLSSRGGGASAWVDLLDAQSKIHPADFRARVAATGARDYGEDVADRNIALSGGAESARPSMSSRNTSFHGSVSGGTGAPFHLQRLAASPDVTTSLTGSHNRHPSGAEEPERPASAKGYPASQEHDSNASWPLLNRIDGFAPRSAGSVMRARSVSGSAHEKQPSDQLARGRRSIHGGVMYAASSNDLSGARSRPASLSRGYSTDGMQRPRTSSNASNLSFSQEMPKMTLAARRQRSNGRMRSRTTDSEASVLPSRDTSQPPPIHTGKQALSDYDPRPMSSGSEQSHIHPTFNAPNWSNSYRLGRIDIESTGDPMASPAPSPYVRRGDAVASLSSSYDRTRSLPSRGRNRLDEIAETAPLRGSSLRHSSVSSATPTTDSVWSSPFPRPQSLHTAQTSIDVPPSPAFPSSLSSTNGAGRDENGCVVNSPVTVVRHESSSSFNIDDYLSDEDDDIDKPKPRKSPDDEGLLFNDSGYGFRGMQLPGLFDAIPEFPSKELPLTQPLSPTRFFHRPASSRHSVGTHQSLSRHSPRSSSVGSIQSEEFHSVGSKPRPASRIFSDVEERKSGEYEDVLSRARSLREEKGVNPGDIKRAIRLRRESKARLRERTKDVAEVAEAQ